MVFVRAHPPCPHALLIPVESSPAATAGTELSQVLLLLPASALGTPSHCAVTPGRAQGSQAEQDTCGMVTNQGSAVGGAEQTILAW